MSFLSLDCMSFVPFGGGSSTNTLRIGFADAGSVGLLDCVQALEPYCTVQSVIVESSFTKMRLPDTVGCAQVALSATS